MENTKKFCILNCECHESKTNYLENGMIYFIAGNQFCGAVLSTDAHLCVEPSDITNLFLCTANHVSMVIRHMDHVLSGVECLKFLVLEV